MYFKHVVSTSNARTPGQRIQCDGEEGRLREEEREMQEHKIEQEESQGSVSKLVEIFIKR